jgi:hypothetical protein
MYEVQNGGATKVRKVASRRFLKPGDVAVVAFEVITDKALSNCAMICEFEGAEVVKAFDRDQNLEFESIDETCLIKLPDIKEIYDFAAVLRIERSGMQCKGKLTSDVASVEHTGIPFAVVEKFSEVVEQLTNYKGHNKEDEIMALEKRILALEILLDFSLIDKEEYESSRKHYEEELEKLRINFIDDVKIVAEPVIKIEEFMDHVKAPKEMASKFEDPHTTIRNLLGTKRGEGLLLAKKAKIERYLAEIKNLHDEGKYSEQKYVKLRDDSLVELGQVQKELHMLKENS